MSREKEKLQGFHFLLPVWGKSYTDLFLNIVLPSHLASENIPSLKTLKHCTYHIFSTTKDLITIKKHPAFDKLKSLINTQITIIKEDIANAHKTMSECYKNGIFKANSENCACIFITPDIIFSNNSFSNIEKIALEGKRVVYIACVRLNKNETSLELAEFKDSNILKIEPRKLTDIALNNLHINSINGFFEGSGSGFIPACILWQVKDQGLLSHSFHLHPIMVFPENKEINFYGTLDDDYVKNSCPNKNDSIIISDSDLFLAFELSEHDHIIETDYKRNSISSISSWAIVNCNEHHINLAKNKIFIKGTKFDESSWEATEAKAADIIEKSTTQLSQNIIYLTMRYPISIFRKLQRKVNLLKNQSVEKTNHSPTLSNIFENLIVLLFSLFHDSYLRSCSIFKSLRKKTEVILFEKYLTSDLKAHALLLSNLPEKIKILFLNPNEKFYLTGKDYSNFKSFTKHFSNSQIVEKIENPDKITPLLNRNILTNTKEFEQNYIKDLQQKFQHSHKLSLPKISVLQLLLSNFLSHLYSRFQAIDKPMLFHMISFIFLTIFTFVSISIINIMYFISTIFLRFKKENESYLILFGEKYDNRN